ncbi:MAG: hypothetical protein GY814_18280 [Gammaproteobacteria bacterium]|nr:hypothetical protein [Gammaproteobacteria bacterium]
MDERNKGYILMLDKQKIPLSVSDRALEMVMRDVLDSLSELSLESGFQPTDGGFEIIDIAPAQRSKSRNNKSRCKRSSNKEEGEVLQFPNLHRATG